MRVATVTRSCASGSGSRNRNTIACGPGRPARAAPRTGSTTPDAPSGPVTGTPAGNPQPAGAPVDVIINGVVLRGERDRPPTRRSAGFDQARRRRRGAAPRPIGVVRNSGGWRRQYRLSPHPKPDDRHITFLAAWPAGRPEDRPAGKIPRVTGRKRAPPSSLDERQRASPY